MQLTPHFSVAELTRSEYAVRKGIDNTPNDEVLANLLLLADGLERVRSVLGVSVYISSGYRSQKVNAGIGGATNPPSAHTLGLAADFTAPEFGSPLEICRALESQQDEVDFDQLINEGTWVHISFKEASPRGEILTAHFNGGKATYTRGLA
jgi:zinc D-Ala-D-Ala carboxypeptidase